MSLDIQEAIAVILLPLLTYAVAAAVAVIVAAVILSYILKVLD